MKYAIIIISIILLNLNSLKANEFEFINRFTNTNRTNQYISTIDQEYNIFITGGFEEPINFNPNSEESELKSNDYSDIYLAKLDSEGNHIWSHSFGGEGSQISYTLTIDRNGDILITGLFTESIIFDSTNTNQSFLAKGHNDIFIAKFSSDGKLKWARQIGSSLDEYVRSLSVDSLDNLYISGTFSMETDFDPSENTTIIKPKYGTDIFILKLDANGEFLWVKSLEGDYNENSSVSLIDNNGDFCLTGYFHKQLDFDPSDEEFIIKNLGYTDIFIAKYTQNGDFLWAKSFRGVSRTFVTDMVVDKYDNLIIVGDYTWTVDFDTGESEDTLTSLEMNDGFISKLDKNGNYIWVKRFSGSLGVWISGIELNSRNEILTIGRFARDCDFDTGEGTLIESTTNGSAFYLASLDSNGKLLDASIIDGIVMPRSINLLKDGKVLIGLTLSGDSDFILSGKEIKVKDYFNNDFLFIRTAEIESSIATNYTKRPIEIFPNPAKECIALQFYTDLSSDIGKLELELINISTGVAYNIKDYNISFINNWEGTFDFDVSRFPTGSYLINMKLGEYQRSSKLIIAK